MVSQKFTAKLQKMAHKGGWVYVSWPESEKFFGTRGIVKITGTIDGHPFRSTFMATGEGHMLPVKAETQKLIGKTVGDTVTIVIQERLK